MLFTYNDIKYSIPVLAGAALELVEVEVDFVEVEVASVVEDLAEVVEILDDEILVELGFDGSTPGTH
jgi:hypothetical protein